MIDEHEPMSASRTVLAVEDFDPDAVLLHRFLERAWPGVHFRQATTMQEATRFLNADGGQNIDWIFIDFELSGHCGLELVRDLRAHGDLRPIVIVTGHGNEKVAAECLRAGADDYVSKSSLDAETLLRALKHAEAEHARREAEARLRAQNQRLEELVELAEESARAKTAFLANVSHELRTPLTAILGSVDSLLEDDLSQAEETQALETIYSGGHHLLSLISDVIDLSRLEAGQMTVERRPVGLRELVQEVSSTMRGLIESKGLTFEVGWVPPVPETIETDPLRLRQMMINVLGNACKFTERGEILMRVSVEPDSEPEPLLSIDISDSGIGMEPERVDHVFEPFAQADSSIARRYGGSGLGLAVTRELATLLGGDVILTSALDRGTTARIRVGTGPLAAVRWLEGDELVPGATMIRGIKLAPAPPLVRWSGKALVIDDSQVTRTILSRLLRRVGLEPCEAAGGRDGIVTLATAHEQFRLVVVDLQMPGMDGFEAARLLREGNYRGPLVATSASPTYSDAAIAAGFDAFLPKPFDRAELLSMLSQLFSESAQAA